MKLKIDLDYLRMVTVAERARGFVWSQHQAADFKETPNPNVLALQQRYGDRGVVAHGLLPGVLTVLVPPPPAKMFTEAKRREWTEQKTERIKGSLIEWASKNIGPPEACCVIGSLLEHSGYSDGAVECFKEMVELGRQAGDITAVGAALNNLGTIFKGAGRHDAAVEYYRVSLQCATDAHERTVTLINLGDVHGQQGDEKGATSAYDEAERVATAHNDQTSLAKVYAGRGHLWDVKGKRDDAIVWYRKAETVLESVGAKGLLGECLQSRGAVHRILGESSEARNCFERAGEIARILGDKAALGYAVSGVGALLLQTGDRAGAREQFERARLIAEELGHERTSNRSHPGGDLLTN